MPTGSYGGGRTPLSRSEKNDIRRYWQRETGVPFDRIEIRPAKHGMLSIYDSETGLFLGEQDNPEDDRQEASIRY